MVATPAPVLMLDTCELLDIVRVATRRESKPGLVMAASVLLGKSSLPRTVWSVAAPLLELEWTNNIVTVEDEATRNIQSIGTQLDLLLGAADLLVPGHGFQTQNFTTLGLP